MFYLIENQPFEFLIKKSKWSLKEKTKMTIAPKATHTEQLKVQVNT